MTSPPAAGEHIGLLEVVRSAHPAQVVVVGVLVILTCATVQVAPGLATALWLALVTPSLVILDLRVRRLPNVLVVPGLVTVLVDGVWATIASATMPLAACVTTAIIAAAMLAFNLFGGLGMGDVKLSVVIAGCLSIVSPFLAVTAVTLAFFLGGAYSAVLLLRRRGQGSMRIAFGPVLLLAFWLVVVLRAVEVLSVVSS